MKKRLLLFASLVFFFSTAALAQRTVQGTIVDQEGEALIGVNVIEMGTNKGTITDLDGNYSLTVSEGARLQFSLVGYETTVIEVATRVSLTSPWAKGFN
jgi:hypothetical protein